MNKRILLIFIILLAVFSTSAQVYRQASTPQADAYERDGSYLIKRYESGTSMFRIIEDVQVVWGPGNDKFQGAKYVVRVCSKEKLLPSLPLATVNVIEFADFLTADDGYKKSDVLFVRSENCEGIVRGEMHPTELWVVKTESNLPPNVEHYKLDQMTILSLGFDPVRCTNTDSSRVAATLARKMAHDPKSYGAVIEYYIERPSEALEKNAKRAVKIIEKYGISSARLVVALQAWHDGDSACINREPKQPRVLFVTLR